MMRRTDPKKPKAKKPSKPPKKPLKQRLLPGDFQRYLKQQQANHYHKLNETAKELDQPRGFFTIPEQLEGEQDIGEIHFLAFYFDHEEDYEVVRAFFEISTSAALSHPRLDAELLAEVVREYKERHRSEA